MFSFTSINQEFQTYSSTTRVILLFLFVVYCVVIGTLLIGSLLGIPSVQGNAIEFFRIAAGGEKPSKSIFDITGVQNDACIAHKPHSREIFTDRLKELCKKTKIKLGDKMDISKNQTHIALHNSGKACLAGCLFDWKERRDRLFGLLKSTKIAMKKLDVDNWVLYYGGLIGWIRNKTLLPWDPDLDILVPVSFVTKYVEKGKTKIIYEDDKIVVRAGHRNFNIAGTVEDKDSGLYSDIFAYEEKDNTVEIRWVPTPGRPVLKVKSSDFFPIRIEKIFDPSNTNESINVPIPANPEANMKERYGKTFMSPPYEKKGEKYLLSGPKINATFEPSTKPVK